MNFFKRKAYVVLDGEKIEGINIRFNVQAVCDNVYRGQISLCNLNKEHEAKLFDRICWDYKKGQKLEIDLYAGYDDELGGKCSCIGRYYVHRAIPSMPPDRWTTLLVQPMELFPQTHQFSVKSTSLDPKDALTGKDILDAISEMTKFEIDTSQVSEDISSKKFGMSMSFNGSIRAIMEQMRELYTQKTKVHVNLEVSEESDDVTFYKICVHDSAKGKATPISIDDGMIGLPQMQDTCHGSAVIQLNPALHLYSLVDIKCARYEQSNGTYTVQEITHCGELLGNQWQTKINFFKPAE